MERVMAWRLLRSFTGVGRLELVLLKSLQSSFLPSSLSFFWWAFFFLPYNSRKSDLRFLHLSFCQLYSEEWDNFNSRGSHAPGGVCGWQYQTTCSELRAASGRVAQPCCSGLSAVVPNQGHGLLHAGCRIQSPRVGLVQKWHGGGGHWNCEFRQVLSGEPQRKKNE